MGSMPGILLRHTITACPHLGAGAHGPVWGEAVTIRCYAEDGQRRVRTSSGAAATASLTVYAPLDAEDNLSIGARVTYAGRDTVVLQVLRHDGGGLPTPDHLEVLCE